jgi:hypothetical protein
MPGLDTQGNITFKPGTITSQSALIKGKIQRHHKSSPAPIMDAVDQVLKGILRMARTG